MNPFRQELSYLLHYSSDQAKQISICNKTIANTAAKWLCLTIYPPCWSLTQLCDVVVYNTVPPYSPEGKIGEYAWKWLDLNSTMHWELSFHNLRRQLEWFQKKLLRRSLYLPLLSWKAGLMKQCLLEPRSQQLEVTHGHTR